MSRKDPVTADTMNGVTPRRGRGADGPSSLPADAPKNPEIQLSIGEDSSPGSIRLAIQSFLDGSARNGRA